MRHPLLAISVLFMLPAIAWSCSAATKSTSPEDTCGTPPSLAAPVVGLAYPANGTTGVPTTLGAVVFQGYGHDSVGPLQLYANGAPLGAPAAAPSPLPSPLESHRRLPAAYFAAPIVTRLTANTEYTVSISTLAWSSQFVFPEAPRCTAPFTATLGKFRTGAAKVYPA